MWGEFKFPPINLWNLPLQYKDVDKETLESWMESWEKSQDHEEENEGW